MKKPMLLLAVVAFLLVAACGDAEDGGAGETAAEVTTTAAAAATTIPATTVAPTTTASNDGIVLGEDPDVDAIVGAYVIAFDSTSGYDEKAPYIDDPTGLEETVAKYLTTGETMGGIGVNVSTVMISGEEAAVTYDLLFNGNPTYPDQPGTAVLTPDGWKVPRSVFCGLMASARVGCPAE